MSELFGQHELTELNGIIDELQRELNTAWDALQRTQSGIDRLQQLYRLKEVSTFEFESLDLSARVYSAIRRHIGYENPEPIKTVLALLDPPYDIFNIRNVGVKSIDELLDKLCEKGHISPERKAQFWDAVGQRQ